MSDLPQSLVDALRAGTLIPFVGAGVSVGAVRQLAPEYRFPDWKGLIEALAARLVLEGKAADAATVRATVANDTMAAAELAMQALGRKPFLDVMEGLFDRRRPRDADLSLVSAIWQLRPPFVVTTNYDRVLEWPFPSGAVRSVGNDDPSYINELTLPSDRRRIWYLHGSIDRIDTIILTAKQYTSLYLTPGDPTRLQYENAAQRFEDVLKTHAFLFIGYSLDEPLLRERMEQVRAVTAQAVPMKYLLLRQGEADAAKVAELRDQFGVQVLEFANFGAPLLETVQGMRTAAWPGELLLSGAGLTPFMAPLVQSLEEACAGVAMATTDVARLFNAVRPAGWESAVPGADPLARLSAAIVKLGSAVSPTSGVHPLLAFADRLKDELVEPALGRVTAWMESAIDVIAGGPVEGALVRQQLARVRLAAAAVPAHILVRIACTSTPSATWRAHAWAYTGNDPESLLGAEGLELRAGEEGDLVAALVEAMETRDFDASITSLSFLLPCALANAPIDQWQLPREIADDPPLGATHLVAVRSLDRLGRHRIMRQRYKKAWVELTARATSFVRILTPGAPPPADALYGAWVDEATACGGMLSASLTAQSVSCVLLAQAPTAEDLAYLSAVLDTPVPVVVWSRDSSIPYAQFELEVRGVVESGPVAELPQRMRQHRAQALAAGASPIGRHLALLWDDADYAPPDTEVAAKAGLPTT
ncbi:MAG: SIR2 family protein [Gemmatimonadota bacterium]